MHHSYVVISPVRNEQNYLEHTLRSMFAQTVKPQRWILVDDGSTDATPSMIDEAAKTNSWITAIHRVDRGTRQAGVGVVEAFYDGFRLIEGDDWDFVVKLDGDLSFDNDYFQRCLDRFKVDTSLGIAGGTCCKQENGVRMIEFQGEPEFHVRGPTKIYRKECFQAIGGLIPAPGWDTVDQIKANMLGWKSLTFPDIFLIHLRTTGAAYGSWKNWQKNGLANYITGYHPLFMIGKCIKRMAKRPSPAGIREGIGLLVGFTRGYLNRVPRVSDPDMIIYLQTQQLRALRFKPSLWR